MKFLFATSLAIYLWACQVRADCMDDETAVYADTCRNGFRTRADHIFPASWSILLDSWDYTTFNDWLRLDRDGISSTDPTTQRVSGAWTPSTASCALSWNTCSNDLTAQQRSQQNNWFFTPHIRFPNVAGVDEVQEIHINISYNFVQCNSVCFVNLFRFDSESPASNGILTSSANNPQPLRGGSVEGSRITSSGTSIINTVINWRIPKPSTNGFHIGFQDLGTCGFITRMIVYYLRDPAYTGTLLTCPSIPYPRMGSADTTTGSCCCGVNAENDGSLARVCSADSTCIEPASDVCGCSPGFEYNQGTQTCDPCPTGMFQPDISSISQCEPCPANSEALFPATGVCNCTGATIRNPTMPRQACTEPPSPPLLTVEPRVDGTFVTLEWGAALRTGGFDSVYYNVYTYQVGTEPMVYRKANTDPIMDVSFEVSGLNPQSSYAIVVVSANPGTGDPETLSQQLTEVEGHYVAYFVDTGDAGLRKGEAIALTFFLTLIFVAIITGVTVFLIMWFLCVKRQGTLATSPKPSAVNSHNYEMKDYHENEDGYKQKTTPPTRPAKPPPRPPTRPIKA